MKFNINAAMRSAILILPILIFNSARAITFDTTTPISPYTFSGNIEVTYIGPPIMNYTCTLDLVADISTGSGGAGMLGQRKLQCGVGPVL